LASSSSVATVMKDLSARRPGGELGGSTSDMGAAELGDAAMAGMAGSSFVFGA
jgi:hypothetical protein